MARAIILLLDSFGIGGAPDAAQYGDAGADTLGHIAEHCAHGLGNRDGLREGPLHLPNLTSLGLVQAARLATGNTPAGMNGNLEPIGLYCCANEVSAGKDTPSGHWEIAGVPVTFEWGYFDKSSTHFLPAFWRKSLRRLTCPAVLPIVTGQARQLLSVMAKNISAAGNRYSTHPQTVFFR